MLWISKKLERLDRAADDIIKRFGTDAIVRTSFIESNKIGHTRVIGIGTTPLIYRHIHK